ncbi:uncharacterized protein [Procambarus clarkii]|uniref:uncharacterized protein n=1 Tax=Procambarus clarkii TaxID=6728 RepID=UPI003743BA86
MKSAAFGRILLLVVLLAFSCEGQLKRQDLIPFPRVGKRTLERDEGGLPGVEVDDALAPSPVLLQDLPNTFQQALINILERRDEKFRNYKDSEDLLSTVLKLPHQESNQELLQLPRQENSHGLHQLLLQEISQGLRQHPHQISQESRQLPRRESSEGLHQLPRRAFTHTTNAHSVKPHQNTGIRQLRSHTPAELSTFNYLLRRLFPQLEIQNPAEVEAYQRDQLYL